jgi:hypothetical protein
MVVRPLGVLTKRPCFSALRWYTLKTIPRGTNAKSWTMQKAPMAHLQVVYERKDLAAREPVKAVMI